MNPARSTSSVCSEVASRNRPTAHAKLRWVSCLGLEVIPQFQDIDPGHHQALRLPGVIGNDRDRSRIGLACTRAVDDLVVHDS